MIELAASPLALDVASGAPLDVRSFRVREAISEPFDVSVVARSPDPSLDLDAIVGRPAAFRIGPASEGMPPRERCWTGICRAAEQEHAEPTGLSTYRFHLVPVLWLLGQRRDHRIFQHRSAPDIAALVLDRWGIERALELDAAAYPPLPYKVQYAESDLAFLCRLLEEAGIAFTFPPGAEGHGVLTLGDRLHAGAPRPRPLPWVSAPDDAVFHDLVTDVRVVDETRPGAHTIRDHDLRRPAYRLFGEAERAPDPERVHEQYHYRPGAFLVDVDTAAPGDTPVADGEGATRHDAGHGRRRAERALASARADKRALTYRTTVLDLWPGRVFTIADHPHPDLDASQRLLAVELTLEGAPGEVWAFRGRAVIAGLTGTPYRPRLRTSRQTARVQSATVVGGGDINTDELGRVLVQFPWDRSGTNTVWIRVSEAWAGAGFGLITAPRVGHEVLVDFLEGDPEQPIVVGRVFNRTNTVIEPLPARETRSAWKSRSSPGGLGFNEIMLEDRAGSELVYAQAQNDARRLVKHDDTSTIVRDRTKLVGADELETTDKARVQETKHDRVELTYGDETTAVDGTRRELVRREALERLEGDQVVRVGMDRHGVTVGERREAVLDDAHLFVGGERPERVGGTDSLIVGEALNESVGSYTVTAMGKKGWIHLIGDKKIVIEAPEVTVKQGPSNFVKVDGKVTIKGADVYIDDGGSSAGTLPGPGPHKPAPPRIAIVEGPAPARIDASDLDDPQR